MNCLEATLEILKIVIDNESFKELDLEERKNQTIQLFESIYVEIIKIEKNAVNEAQENTGENGDKKSQESDDVENTGEKGDKTEKNRDQPEDSGKNGDKKNGDKKNGDEKTKNK